MRFYNQQHRFYCGVDLHTRSISASLRFGLHSAEADVPLRRPKRSEAEKRRPRGGTPETPNVPDAQVRGASISISDMQKLERITPRSRCGY